MLEVVGLCHLPFLLHFLSLVLYPSESHPNPSISLSHCMLSLFHMRDSTVIEAVAELDPGLYGPGPGHQRGTLMIFITFNNNHFCIN